LTRWEDYTTGMSGERLTKLRNIGRSSLANDKWKRYLNMTPNLLQNLFRPLDGDDAEEVKAYGLDVD